MLEKWVERAFRRLVKNRWGYSDSEYEQAASLGLLDALDLVKMQYWLKAEPVCSKHCSGLHTEGKPFFFNALGMLIRHKCPPVVCIHGLAQLPEKRTGAPPVAANGPFE